MRLPTVARCYEKWLELKGQVQSYYTGEACGPFCPLSNRKSSSHPERGNSEAESIRLGTITFEMNQRSGWTNRKYLPYRRVLSAECGTPSTMSSLSLDSATML
jgi:hypothetical protein